MVGVDVDPSKQVMKTSAIPSNTGTSPNLPAYTLLWLLSKTLDLYP